MVAWVTRPERPKGTKDKVKRPRLLVINDLKTTGGKACSQFHLSLSFWYMQISKTIDDNNIEDLGKKKKLFCINVIHSTRAISG